MVGCSHTYYRTNKDEGMSWHILGAVALAYAVMGLVYYRQGRYGMMLAFIAYALANVGFIIDIYEVGKR